MIEFTTECYFTVTSYLDDYLFIASSKEECNYMVRSFIQLCGRIGCPISDDKTEWATDAIIFLGILINGKDHCLCIPEEKRRKALGMIDWVIQNRKVTIRFVQQLTGMLNFLNRAIVPGRAFTKGMYDKLKLRDRQGNLLKQYHHMKLGESFIEDCRIWKQFLMNASASELCRPFIDLNQFAEAETLQFYSDVSLNRKLGMGSIYKNSWIQGYWGERFIDEESPNIEFLELFALVAAILTWGHCQELTNTRIIIFCDNQASQQMVNNLASNCSRCMKLIRILTLNNLQFNRRVFVKYVASKSNILADALSRGDMNRFWKNAPKTMDKKPCTLPPQIWPVSKVWFDE